MVEDELVFISTNEKKLQDVKKRFEQFHMNIHYLQYPHQEIYDEDLFLITVEKALFFYEAIKRTLLVMDSGFYIQNYPLRPNYPGSFVKQEFTREDGIDRCLQTMRKVEDRTCLLRECLIYFDGIHLQTFEGERKGTLIPYREEGRHYTSIDQIFKPVSSDKTLDQMTYEERLDKKDGHIDALELFHIWYSDDRKKRKIYQKTHKLVV